MQRGQMVPVISHDNRYARQTAGSDKKDVRKEIVVATVSWAYFLSYTKIQFWMSFLLSYEYAGRMWVIYV